MITKDLLPGFNFQCTTDEIIRYNELLEKCNNLITSFEEAPKEMLITRKIIEDLQEVKLAILKI